jgi:hypothetical protein
MALPDETLRKYAWVDDIEAWTVAVINGPAADEVVRIYGGDPEQPLGDLRFAKLDDLRLGSDDAIRFHLQVMQRDGLVVAIENDGYSGAFPEIARRCSAHGGWFFSVYWNIHAAGFVTQAVDGAIVAQFESLYPRSPDEGQWERRPEWAIGPDVEANLAWQACMALLEQQTGVEIEQSWLSEPYPTFRIPEPYFLYRDVEGADRI